MYGLISPKGRIAAIFNDNEVDIHNSAGEHLYSLARYDAERLFFRFDDVLEIKNATPKQIFKKLDFENRKIETLYLILTILDLSVPDKSKEGIKILLEDVLTDGDLIIHLKRTLYSHPLFDPPQSYQDVLRGLVQFPLLHKFLNELISAQNVVNLVFNTWKSEFLNRVPIEEHESANNVLTHSGLAFELSKADVQKGTISSIKFMLLKKLEKIRNSRQLIGSFFSSLDIKSLNVVTADLIYQPKSETDIEAPKEVRYKKYQAKVHKVFKRAKTEIEYIKTLLNGGDSNKALSFANELVERQVASDDSVYASMSLSSLAEHAKELENYTLMLSWAQRAHDVNPLDGRPVAQIADAYLLLNDFERARLYYELYQQWGGEAKAYALAGLARLYRAKHDYETALSFIEESLEVDPNDPVHACIRAEILADVGRFNEAEQLYYSLTQLFPERVAIQCGLAAMLAEQRKFEKAEKLYRDTVRLWPKDQIPRTALGFLLAKQGQFKEAYQLLDEGIKLCQFDSFIPVNAKATALKMDAKFAEAKVLLSEYIQRHPLNIEPYVYLIDAMVSNGEMLDALKICDSYISERGSADLILRAKGYVLRKLGRFTEALAVVDDVVSRHPKWPIILCDKGDLLRTLGLNDDARALYECALSVHRFDRRAQNGLKLLNALTHLDAPTTTVEEGATPVTYDDWDDLSVKGLILLSKKDYVGAQTIFANCEKDSPFKTIGEKIKVPFAASDLGLKHFDRALEKVSELTSQLAVAQKIIIFCQLKNFIAARGLVESSETLESDGLNIIPLIKSIYLSDKPASNDGFYNVLDAHVKTLLKVA